MKTMTDGYVVLRHIIQQLHGMDLIKMRLLNITREIQQDYYGLMSCQEFMQD